jgi:pyridinium-3,5-biscarboxylic acid mononucleotide sulfurtransferase
MKNNDNTNIINDKAALVAEKLATLRKLIHAKGSLVVAFSGGLDSTIIAKVAYEELGDKAVAVTINSDTFSSRELDMSKETAAEIGIKQVIDTVSELDNADFVKNPLDRCYHCKKEEMDIMKKVAAQMGFNHIAFGVNVSDFGEHRPGIKALNEEGFFQPLVEAGIGKDIMKDIGKLLGLTNYDMPSTTCLASRIPYGQSITAKKLTQIEEAENALYAIGFRNSRVRNYGDMARVEVDEDQIERVVEYRKSIVSRLKELGFVYVTLDLVGYRSGSMNEIL